MRDALTRNEYQSTYMNYLIKDEIEKGHSNPFVLLRDSVAKDAVTRHANQLDMVASRWETRLQSMNETGLLKTIENRLGTFEEFVLKIVEESQGIGNTGQDTSLGSVMSQLNNIQRAFNEDRISKIKDNLKEIGSPWCLEIFQKLQEVDEQLADTIIGQIEYATENDYVSCLVNEYNVALKRVGEQTGIDPFVLSGAEYLPRSPIKAMLPIKEYYRDFPDAVRMGLNNYRNCDPFVHKNFGETFRTFLNLRGIDTLNPVVNLDVIREVLWRRKKNLMDVEKEKEVRDLLLNNPDAKNKYLTRRKKAVEEFMSNPKINLELDRRVADAFNNKLWMNKKLMFDRSRSLQPLVRKEKVANLRKLIINTSLTRTLDDLLHTGSGKGFSIPLEISNNPQRISREVNMRHRLKERAAFFKTKRNLNPLKLHSFMNGNIEKADLYDIEMVNVDGQDLGARYKTSGVLDPKGDEMEGVKIVDEVIEEDYFGNYHLQKYPRADLSQRWQYLLYLDFFRIPDQREEEFRENYIKRVLDTIEKGKGSKLTEESREEIAEKIRDLHFDYTNGSDYPYDRTNPHFMKKNVWSSLNDIFLMHASLTDDNKEQVPVDLKEFEWISDLERMRFDRSAALNEHVRMLREGNDTFVSGLINIATSYLTTSEEYKELVGGLCAVHPSNSLITRINELMYRNLMVKYVEVVSNLPNGSEKNYIPLLDGLANQGKQEEFMKSLDYFLVRNMEFDFMQFSLPSALFEYSFDVLDDFEKLLNDFTRDNESDEKEAAETKTSELKFRRKKMLEYLKVKLGIKDINLSEVAEATEYLDQLMFNMAEINLKEKDRIHLKKDRVIAYGSNSNEVLSKKGDSLSEMNPEGRSDDPISKKTVRDFPHKIARRLSKAIENQNAKKKWRTESFKAASRTALDEAKYGLNEPQDRNPNASYDQMEQVADAYRARKLNNIGNSRILIPGPLSIMLELEGVIKKMNEGILSGIDDDFSELKNILKETVITNNQNEKEWVDQKIMDYFEMLFRIREKYEDQLPNDSLRTFDSEFAEFFTPEKVKEMVME